MLNSREIISHLRGLAAAMEDDVPDGAHAATEEPDEQVERQYANGADFAIGDAVQLNSGSYSMTVVDLLFPDNGDPVLVCALWIDDDGRPHHIRALPQVFKHYSPEGE